MFFCFFFSNAASVTWARIDANGKGSRFSYFSIFFSLFGVALLLSIRDASADAAGSLAAGDPSIGRLSRSRRSLRPANGVGRLLMAVSEEVVAVPFERVARGRRRRRTNSRLVVVRLAFRSVVVVRARLLFRRHETCPKVKHNESLPPADKRAPNWIPPDNKEIEREKSTQSDARRARLILEQGSRVGSRRPRADPAQLRGTNRRSSASAVTS